MDIRAYFSRKSCTTPTSKASRTTSKEKVGNKQSTSKRKPSAIFDSDSDDGFVEEKYKKRTPVKNKRRIIDSSDSENDSSSKKSKTESIKSDKRLRSGQISNSSGDEVSSLPKERLNNLQNVITSKFFKQTTAADMFGNEPIKRNDTKLKEVQEKLRSKRNKKPENDIPQIPDDDADFAATVEQMEKIGGDGWIDWNSVKSSQGKSPKKKQSENEEKNTNKTSEKAFKEDHNLVKSITSKNFINDSNSGSSNCDSGFESQSCDWQNVEGNDSSITNSKSPRTRSKTPNLVESNANTSKVSPKVSKSPSTSCKVLEQCLVEPKVIVPRLSDSKLTNFKDTRKKKDKVKISDTKPSIIKDTNEKKIESNEENCLWVEKHKPTSTKKIIGQQGDKSNVKKLTQWLNNWYKNNTSSKKAIFVQNGWNKDPTGACFKAALLSGPPGVGKTTSVNLICKELGFDTVEFNASDTRSKRLLEDEVSRLLTNTSLTPYFTREDSNHSVTKKHVLVMDEVDGMAGNEDRGGVQELIQLIKTTKVPIICMCNDRNHPKIRSLVNYCFDLRFSRPRVEQIKGFIKSVCFKEKLNISTDTLTDLITSANNDIRLILNHLSMLAADKSDLEAAKKHIKLSPWDVLRKVFAKEDHKTMSIHDKCDLFFFDYSIAPLFVQENYLSVKPLNVDANDKQKKMELFARAADSISIGDTVDKAIRGNMAWSLLPTQAVFASYIPGEILEGYCGGQINFPSWLGKNSRRNKIDRLLQEIQIHTRLKLSASKESINMDYASHLRNQIVGPLVRDGTDGVKSALQMLHEYQLLKDDLDSLHEICQWPNITNHMTNIDSKVKAAFTRMYNKNPPVRPYSLVAPLKKTTSIAGEDLGIEDEENEEEEKSGDETDAMIIVKKKTQSTKKDEPGTSSSKAKPKTNNASKRGRKK